MMIKKFYGCGLALCLMAAVLVNNGIVVQAAQDSRQAPTNAETEKATETSVEGETGSELLEFTQEEIESFYDDSVFVGDSVMLGFRNYAQKRKDDTLLSRMKFLAAGSLSVNNAFWDTKNKKSVHPIYKGQKRYIWDSLALMESKRVFIMLGINDLNVYGLEKTRDKYKELIEKIEESCPDVEVYIMSMTYVLHGKEKGNLKNDTIREFNAMLEELAKENEWGYVSLADSLADENGDLAKEFCSDGFVHQNAAAYDVWVSVLRDYAAQQLSNAETEENNANEVETEESISSKNAEMRKK